MTTDERKSKVLKTYLSGRFSPATERKVQHWILEEETNPELESASLEYWGELETEPDRLLEKYRKRVFAHAGIEQERRVIPLRRRWLRVAAVLLPLLLLAGGYYTFSRARMTRVQVAAGEQQYLLLPDSSEVWINSGSTLRFPRKFSAGKREVSLEGEAYFSVRPDSTRPFEVQTAHLSVRVLGTRFNLKDYAEDERAVATLNSGKVAVRAGGKKEHILSPREQLVYDRLTSAIRLGKVDDMETVAWIQGDLIFSDASFREIILGIERKFAVSVNVNIPDRDVRELYTIKFVSNESLPEVMQLLGEMIGFTYSIQDNQITLNKR